MKCCNSKYPHKILNEYLEGKSQNYLSATYGIHGGNISRFLHQHGIKVRPQGGVVQNLHLHSSALKPCWNLGYILGVTSGDGWITKTQNRNYNIGLQTIDEEFADRFRSCLEKWLGKPCLKYRYLRITGFNATPKIYYTVLGTGKAAYQFIKDNQAYGTGVWRIPNIIKDGEIDIQSGYLRGFYDSEGSDMRDRIRLYSINFEGLQDIRTLLGRLSVLSKINPIRHQWYLVMYGDNMRVFRELIECPRSVN